MDFEQLIIKIWNNGLVAIEYIERCTGNDHIAIGSDLDGFYLSHRRTWNVFRHEVSRWGYRREVSKV